MRVLFAWLRFRISKVGENACDVILSLRRVLRGIELVGASCPRVISY